MSASLRERVVLITGPARGIGAAMATRLAQRGARLSLVGLEPERLEALVRELPGAGGPHVWFECDVTDQASLDRAVAGTVAELGGIDIVVANAGIANNGTVTSSPVEALVRTVDVNLNGVVRTVKSTLPHVTERRGYYLLISSAAAFATMPGLSAYAASKAGVEFFGNALRLEVAHLGVRVGIAHPCWVDTDLVNDLRHELGAFDRMLRELPGPFGTVTPVGKCADALVRAIETRTRKVFIPRSLAPLAAIRQLFMSPLSEFVMRRRAREAIPEVEREMKALGRAFGKSSVGMGRRE